MTTLRTIRFWFHVSVSSWMRKKRRQIRSRARSRAGVMEAVKKLLSEKNTLFEYLIGKLNDYLELRERIYMLLFQR